MLSASYVNSLLQSELRPIARRKVTFVADFDPAPPTERPLTLYPGGSRKEFSLEFTGSEYKRRVLTFPGNLKVAYEDGDLVWISAPVGTDAEISYFTETEVVVPAVIAQEDFEEGLRTKGSNETVLIKKGTVLIKKGTVLMPERIKKKSCWKKIPLG